MPNSKPSGVSYSDPDLTQLNLNGVAVTSTAAELNKSTGVPASVSVVVTTPGASGTCDVAMTFKDAAGVTCAFVSQLSFSLVASTGLTYTTAITSIAAADTPVGSVSGGVTGQRGELITTAAGLASVKLTGSNATSYYLSFQGAGGRPFMSAALLTKA